ncbi:hypothetical protein RZS08_05905 [Arthrospira platensis SPKY1]|nr:hypothetical protein [Arthrospira platensis SPKY1]
MILAFVIAVRIVAIAFLTLRQPIEIGAFPVNGRVFARPLLVDLILPIMLLILLNGGWLHSLRLNWRSACLALAEAVLLSVAVLTPTAWLLQGQLQVSPSLTLTSTLRLVQFTLDFLALNLLLDLLAGRPKWEQRLYTFLASLALIYAEDLLIAALSLWAATLYLRSIWRLDRGRALLTAFLCGVGILAIKVTGYHHYYQMVWGFLLFVLFLTLSAPLVILLFAWLWRVRAHWGLGRKALSVATWVIAVGIVRVTLLPSPPSHPFPYVEQIGVVRLEYADERVADFGRERARILDAALSVSKKYYHVTPKESARVVLVGVGSGGFYYLSPGSVYETYGRVWEKALDPATPPADVSVYDGPHMPFGILHEFCHTFGGPSYLLWGEPINEGWASYCGTRLMKLIYQDYGPILLRAPYDYGAYADTLTNYPLENEQGLFHRHEYTGFRLWAAVADRIGERELFQRFMAVMSHEFSSITLDPLEAKRISEAMAPELFAQYGFTYPASYWWLDLVLSALVILTSTVIKIRWKGFDKTQERSAADR